MNSAACPSRKWRFQGRQRIRCDKNRPCHPCRKLRRKTGTPFSLTPNFSWVVPAPTSNETVFNGFHHPVSRLLSPLPVPLSRSMERIRPVLRQESHFGQDRIIAQT